MPHTHPTLHLRDITAVICPLMLRLSWHSPRPYMGQTDLVRYILHISWLMNTSRKGSETLVRQTYMGWAQIHRPEHWQTFFQSIKMLKLFLTRFQLGVHSLVFKRKSITQRMQGKLYKLASWPEAISWLTLFTSKDIRNSTYKEAEKSPVICREQEILTRRQYPTPMMASSQSVKSTKMISAALLWSVLQKRSEKIPKVCASQSWDTQLVHSQSLQGTYLLIMFYLE